MLMAASDDDMSPAIQQWDLRQQAAPRNDLLGHDKVVGPRDTGCWTPSH